MTRLEQHSGLFSLHQGADMGLDRCGQKFRAVSALQDGDESAVAALLRDLLDDARQAGESLGGDSHAAQPISGLGVEAGRDEDEVGSKGHRRRTKSLLECADIIGIPRTGGDGHIDREARTGSGPGL